MDTNVYHWYHGKLNVGNSGFSQYKMVTAGVKDLSETVVYKFLVKGNDVKFLSYRMFKSFYQFLSMEN
jgi:hypothetical protein